MQTVGFVVWEPAFRLTFLPDSPGSMPGIVQNFCIIRVSKMSSNYNVAQLKGTLLVGRKKEQGK